VYHVLTKRSKNTRLVRLTDNDDEHWKAHLDKTSAGVAASESDDEEEDREDDDEEDKNNEHEEHEEEEEETEIYVET